MNVVGKLCGYPIRFQATPENLQHATASRIVELCLIFDIFPTAIDVC
jgi:hypothetical protein